MLKLHIHVGETRSKPEKRPSRKNALILWLIAIIGLLATGFLRLPYSIQDPFVAELISDLIYYLPFAVLPVYLLAKRRPGLSEAYRLGSLSFSSMLMIVVLAVLAVFFINDITVLWAIPFEELGFDPYVSSTAVATNTRELMLSMLSVAVIPAVCEEFLFRGAILPALEGYGTKRAMWLSALMFMGLHMSIIGAPGELISGMLMAYLVFYCDSIYASIVYHTVYNAAILLLEFVQNGASAATDAASSMTLLESIGGLPGVLSTAVSIAISWLLIRALLRLLCLPGRLCRIKLEERKKQALSRGETLLLILTVATCALGYLGDFIIMRGGGL